MFFGLFDSVEKKTRKIAANWLELADKVHNYRRDVLSDAERVALQQAAGSLRRQLHEKNDAGKLKLGIEALESVLRRTGGMHYPKSGLVENIEFFLVAAIVILGMRMYFVQPFKIPTNSMWPSYNGMTAEVFASKADEPGAAAKALRLVAMGARPKTIDAPSSGEVVIPIVNNGSSAIVPYEEVKGRSWLIFPARLKAYTLLVNGKPVKITLPWDFDFEWVIRDAFFKDRVSSRDPGRVDLATLLRAQKNTYTDEKSGIQFLRTGKTVGAGERVLSFDILTGDQLFVDRLSYHFVRPSVGDGFVFRTGNIEEVRRTYGDQYYIKRLVGSPGDMLQVKNFRLYRNGAPITGSKAFESNATQTGNYVGYRGEGLLANEHIFEVPADSYFAMGDNSANSGDSRYWGGVPAKDVVGRPLFIYYPFTKRWGPAP
jgi:signal peptidase I